MVLYFSATGNSKYIASALADKLDDALVPLNDVIKYNKEKVFTSSKPFVIVTPIYAWRIPRIIESLIIDSKFVGNQNIYFVASMGGNSGKTDEYCKLIANKKNLSYLGFRGIIMPDNYISMYSVENEEEINRRYEKADMDIKEITEAIKELKPIYKTDKTPLAGLMSKQVNKMFYKYYVTDEAYYVNDSCISCGICEKECPVNNIKLIDGRPSFNHNCISCYACLHICPKESINVKGKTEGKKRYICKEYLK